MNRLTYKNGRGSWAALLNGSETTGDLVDRLAAYEESGLEPEDVMKYREIKISDDAKTGDVPPLWHIVHLIEADAEGRLLVLPCKVGDSVYRPLYGKVWEGIVLNFCFEETVSASIQNVTGGAIVFEHKEDFGKTVFLTREEAEKALAERRCE